MKRSCLSAVVCVFVIVFLTRAFWQFVSNSSTFNDSEVSEAGGSSVTTRAKTTTAAITTEEPKVVYVIDHLEQTNDTWKMTYTGYEITDELDIFTTAKEGTEFVIVYFEIENITDEEQSFSAILTSYAEFYIDGYKVSQVTYGVMKNNAYQLLSVPVESNRKAKGYFLFQTETNWQTLEISYDDDIFGDGENKMSFTLTKK